MTTDITTRAAVAGAAQAPDRRHVAAECIDEAELECLLLDPRVPDSSLAGNSELAVLGLATGDVVGLHFAGSFRDTNYAVAADIVGAALARTFVRASASGIGATVAAEGEEGPPISAANYFDSRRGYAADFLGSGDLLVPLPRLNGWESDVSPVTGAADVDGPCERRPNGKSRSHGRSGRPHALT